METSIDVLFPQKIDTNAVATPDGIHAVVLRFNHPEFGEINLGIPFDIARDMFMNLMNMMNMTGQ